MCLSRFWHPRSLVGASASFAVTAVAHRKWKQTPNGTPGRGMLDFACHLGTALGVILPVLPNTQHRREFGLVALCSSVALDIDHVFAARSLAMRSWMTMPSRPPTHSIGAMVVMAWAVERLAPGRRLWLAATLGIGSHLLRDLATGGAPLWHPRRVISWPVPTVLMALAMLPVVGWYLAGLPLRPHARWMDQAAVAPRRKRKNPVTRTGVV